MPRKNSVRFTANQPARPLACALTIAGSDSGGGAGIQADLKTFAALRVHGASAITCVTAQNPLEVRAIQPIRPQIVRDQIDAVLAELRPAAVKTGMLFSSEIIKAAASALKPAGLPIVIDPVMIATSGAMLLKPAARRALIGRLFPLATIVTPNIDEAEQILEREIRSPEQARQAAVDLHSRFGCAALVKGGHLRGLRTAVDFYCDGRTDLMLEAPFVRGISSHGTGCTYSAAIAACLALGKPLVQAVVQAKEFISNAIARSQRCASHSVLNPFWK